MNESSIVDIIRGRRSIRRFLDRPVERETIMRLIEAAGWAPSAGNLQDWRFTVVTSPAVKREMARAVRERWDAIIAANRESGFIEEVEAYVANFSDFEKASAVIVVSARAADSVQMHLLGNDATTVAGSATSAGMAAQNLMLAAYAEGFGTCCMTGALAAREALGRILNLSRKQEIVCLVTLGWPAETPAAPARKPVEEIARFVE